MTERSLSIMYELTRETVEEVVREQARLMARAAATAAARTACLLIALVSYDSWTTAIRDDAAAIERSFRNGRARKRGLEDGLMLIELRAQANSGAA